MSLKFREAPDGSWVGYRVTDSISEEQSIDAAGGVVDTPDYDSMDDEALGALIEERGIDAAGKTRRQVINALKKAE